MCKEVKCLFHGFKWWLVSEICCNRKSLKIDLRQKSVLSELNFGVLSVRQFPDCAVDPDHWSWNGVTRWKWAKKSFIAVTWCWRAGLESNFQRGEWEWPMSLVCWCVDLRRSVFQQISTRRIQWTTRERCVCVFWGCQADWDHPFLSLVLSPAKCVQIDCVLPLRHRVYGVEYQHCWELKLLSGYSVTPVTKQDDWSGMDPIRLFIHFLTVFKKSWLTFHGGLLLRCPKTTFKVCLLSLEMRCFVCVCVCFLSHSSGTKRKADKGHLSSHLDRFARERAQSQCGMDCEPFWYPILTRKKSRGATTTRKQWSSLIQYHRWQNTEWTQQSFKCISGGKTRCHFQFSVGQSSRVQYVHPVSFMAKKHPSKSEIRKSGTLRDNCLFTWRTRLFIQQGSNFRLYTRWVRQVLSSSDDDLSCFVLFAISQLQTTIFCQWNDWHSPHPDLFVFH